MLEKKTWKEFQNTGLLLFVNQLLHIFGWAIVFVIDAPTGEVMQVYPARVKFRGFDEPSTEEAYKKISKFMSENAKQLEEEANA